MALHTCYAELIAGKSQQLTGNSGKRLFSNINVSLQAEFFGRVAIAHITN
ncbi:hypothetical protein [Nostoc sp. FACHB-110]|nr:hypothetical protein [Nostoc sp. FACHB-110]MBD2439646.1 hypothetical protein [Nostoc sp. FACHB-110]